MFEDGSGMSHKNRISTNELTLLLLKERDEQNYDLLYNALPVGGQKGRLVGGTLKNRFTQAPYLNKVHAKTGSITGVYT
ncbi:D-alanyl-D-alanine carboxypeptidase, partial [Paraburkholderia sp. SIMBA_027]|uniref:D-alanyl-D-alanine carboxypeptidase n=1 Tax=Paraburkholderia sp. SIMBA_027 TaxID=3085770 RepID=UPI003979953F